MTRQITSYYKKSFFYALIMALVLFLPFVIIDGGYFTYCGDYNAQQIPFYKECIRAIQSGNIGWNWHTDLGVNFIGSYSFYTLGSPFFWIAALFPASISQYLMAPLLALKMALSSLFAFTYIKRFVVNPQNALIGGLLYAFSGYSIYNIFFNHFHEAIVFFPLLLIGLEECVINKRYGAFALSVAINAFVNYFFFVGECVFLVLYFTARTIYDRNFRIKFKDFLHLAFESVCGVMIACVLFMPSILQVLDVPRSTSILSGWEFLFYEDSQRYGMILESMFFPGEVPAVSRMFPDSDADWSSVALYLPLFSMSGVIALMKGGGVTHKSLNWVRILLPVCLIMAMVPGLNASFIMFSDSFYTRWFYMPELICALATVYVLENKDMDMKFGIKFCAAVTTLISLCVLLFPEPWSEDETKLIPHIANGSNISVCINIVMSIGSLVLLWNILRQRNSFSEKAFTTKITLVTITCCMIFSYYDMGYDRLLGRPVGQYNDMLSSIDDINIDDEEFYRIEHYGDEYNANMLWDENSFTSFISIVPSSIFDMYETIGFERTVRSNPEKTYYALRSYTHTKYLIVHVDYKENELEQDLADLRTFKYLNTQGDYDIYVNTKTVPMGCAYDTYIAETDISKGEDSHADNLMINSVILNDEQIAKYSDILQKQTPQEMTDDELYQQFLLDVDDRNRLSVDTFVANGDTFTSDTSFTEDKLVVFSVPFDKGWSCSVITNGKHTPLEIEKVNGGFIGVRVPSGNHTLSFSYETPGLKLGLIVTIIGVLTLVSYMVLNYIVLKHRAKPHTHYYHIGLNEPVKAHTAYIKHICDACDKDTPKKG